MEEIKSYHIRYARIFEPKSNADSYFKHVHNNYELYLFIEGDADYIIEDRLYNLLPYSLILIKPSLPHYIRIKRSEKAYERVTIHFEKDAIRPELFSCLESAHETFYLEKDSEILNCYNRLNEAYRQFNEGDKSLLLSMCVNEILMRLRYLNSFKLANASIVHPVISKILNYINLNLCKPLDIKTISQDLFLSPTYISHIFSTHLKMSIMGYIKQKKIFLAQNLIRSGVKPTEAARMCGFESYSTFYRLYKSMINQLPSFDPDTE